MDESSTLVDENKDVSGQQSAENFQKYIFDLFEKNGVINDLRAYLRGHIVNVLKSSQTGETLVCQKNYTQRLDLTFQAINILIAEYLLRLEFSYSLSVFISEIPLANMVFSFARMLMETNDHAKLKFKDPDVFSILKYIGIKCDSEHANLILEMYHKNDKTPLLLCILRCLPAYRKEADENGVLFSSSQDSLSSKSSGESATKHLQEICTHHMVCKTCRNRITRLKEKYKKKRKSFVTSLNDNSINSINVDLFLKNISSMEKGLIDELFQQLKSVYEAEMEMIKQDEDKRVQRSVALHLLKLRQKREQLESTYKARESELQMALTEKKKFLWSLAKTLREQHQHMSKAMADVKAETERLAHKEDSLRLQLLEAEKILRERGAEMRRQISSELTILEAHLESMKKERDSINRERLQLQNLKLPNANLKPLAVSDDLRSHYDLLRDELTLLKRYLQSAKLDPKCVMERSTMTELSGVLDKFEVVLNNGQEIDAKSEPKPRRLNNDLKKHKNVNFDQVSIDEQSHKSIEQDQAISRSRSSASSEAGDAPDADLSTQYYNLQHENIRLRDFARQQRDHIESLSWQQARLQAQLSSQLTPALTSRTTSTLTRPVTPQNNAFTQQNNTITQQKSTITQQNSTITQQNNLITPQIGALSFQTSTITSQTTTLAPQTSFTLNKSIIQNPNFVSQSTSFATQNAPQTFVSQNTFATQLLTSRPQPVTNRANVPPRPRTAPLNDRIGNSAQRVHPTASVNNLSVGWRVGAGEELSMFSGVAPRIVLPGDSIPFVGVVGTRHSDNRRYLINQWRSLRRRMSPLSGVLKRSSSPNTREKKASIKLCTTTPNIAPDKTSSNVTPSCSKNETTPVRSARFESNTKDDGLSNKREKSPQTVLKEAKEKLKTNDQFKIKSPVNRDKSPNSVLREAKLRLKKLEIEAEAVEKSYLDFRKKRESMKEEFKDDKVSTKIHFKTNSTEKLNETYTKETNYPPPALDVDKYLAEITAKLDFSKYNNKITTAVKISPIPNEYSDSQDKKKENYLETPIAEFRKFYQTCKRFERTDGASSPRPLFSKCNDCPNRSPLERLESPKSPVGTRKKIIREVKNDKQKELEILKENISKIYNMSPNSIGEVSKSNNDDENIVIEKPEIVKETVEVDKKITGDEIENEKQDIIKDSCSAETLEDNNLLRVDVENALESNNLTSSKRQDYFLFIESSVHKDTSNVESTKEKISTQMTLIVSPERSPKQDNGAAFLNTQIAEVIQTNNFNADLQILSDLENSRQIEDADYFDDFSDDVDNYNSRSEFCNPSPVSLAQTSDEENFWDS